MKVLNYIVVLLSICSLTSCEEVIDLDLNSADPKYVIEANLNDINSTQTIKISKTVNFNEPIPNEPVNNAQVVVIDVAGRAHAFTSNGSGLYTSSNFKPITNGNYSLSVNVDGKEFLSTTTRVPYVEVDSLGILKDEVFNETYYAVTFKFLDPINTANYYKYSYSVNGKPFKFSAVFSDKFNNGLLVTHEITERSDADKFVLGDDVTILRECINVDVYNFWSDLQSINPGSAAPANPKSNISNGALGFFSVSSAKLYNVTITDSSEEE
ncbi:DUF4249 domain-containing protein [Sphingobacterium rhinopitheci]|uniref:DUF4249 domain-containing protein n=1 Tax=Sphingobacterium rhinopitheci TaxID=2781960 RepID=UPI001F522DDF|nr:DUF4249 domain-containing protein [Sphingobacterium rhinopitheci]MCI0921268.1 DUF4249 domain-containing protein [Sphingobacterium rhinopitheci]